MLVRVLIILSISLYGSLAFAADPPIYSHYKKGAINGTDPVAYFSLPAGAKAVKGSPDITYIYKGAVWRFASEENKQKFINNPEMYEPQYGGYCAFAASFNFTTSIRPNSWSIVDGKLYLNHNNSSMKRFTADRENKIIKADKNWPNLLTRCERRKNCRKWPDLDKLRKS